MKSALTVLLQTSILSLTNHPFLFSQTQFQTVVGGAAAEIASSIIQTTDGGYAVAGRTQSFGAGNFDFYMVKLGSGGTFQWSRTFGGPDVERPYEIIFTTDGGYALTGYTMSYGAGNSDLYIVKLDSSGMLQWSKAIGGTNYDSSEGSILTTSDGGYALTGYTESFGAGDADVYVVKLDAAGELDWNKTIGGTGDDYANSIIRTADSGYAIFGSTTSFGAGNFDFYMVKLDSAGVPQWSRTFGGNSWDAGRSIIQTADRGFAMAGETYSFGAGTNDMLIVKIDSSGALQWTKAIGGTSGDYAWSIIQTSDTGYAVGGYTGSFGPGVVYIVKLDSGGTLKWSKIVGGTFTDAFSIIQTSDGGYAVAGSTDPTGTGRDDFYIVKLDASGIPCGDYASPTSTVTSPSPTVTSPTSALTIPTPIITTPVPPTVSSGGTVTTVCITLGVPVQVVLVSPDNGAVVADDSVSLVWNESSPNIDRYWLEIDKDSLFSDPFVDSLVIDTTQSVGSLKNHQTNWWRVRAHNENGWGEFSDVWSFSVILTDAGHDSFIPRKYSLSQNYPNPFNPSTIIRYDLAEASFVTLKVYDLLGREVATLVNEEKSPGSLDVVFDASGLASGVYIYKLTAGPLTETKKLILVR